MPFAQGEKNPDEMSSAMFVYADGWVTYVPPTDFPLQVGPGPEYSARFYVFPVDSFNASGTLTCRSLLPSQVNVNGVSCRIGSAPYVQVFLADSP